jgi:hypothetical protein
MAMVVGVDPNAVIHSGYCKQTVKIDKVRPNTVDPQ